MKSKKGILLDLNGQTLPVIEQITDGMPGGFFIYHADENEELIYANTAMVNIFGCDSLEDFRRYVGGSFRGLVHPEDLEQVEKSIQNQISKSSKGLDYVEYRVTRKDGVIRWIRDYGRFVHTELYGDVFYVFVEDATERHLREINNASAVQMARERLEVLRQLEHETTALRMVHEIFKSSMWSMELNELGEISQVNWSSEFRSMLGYHDENDFPNTLDAWFDLIHEEDRERTLTAFYATIADPTGEKTFSVVYRLLTKDRGWRWFQTVGRISRRDAEAPTPYVGILVDITRQRLTDEALDVQRRLLGDALNQAQRAKQARSVFLSNISHLLRNPMNSIMGFTTLASLSADKKGEVADYLDKIMFAAKDLQNQIEHLLDISRAESQEDDNVEDACSLPEILWDLESVIRAEARSKQLKLTVGIEKLTHPQVLCDSRKLKQALMQPLCNALQFTPPGGRISLRLSESPGAPTGYGFYTFQIKDTGIGITKEHLAHIFDPSPVEISNEAHGIGLVITRSIVESMGGTIQIESEEDKGTTCQVSIQFLLAEQE